MPMTEDRPRISIASSDLQVEIDPLGAQLFALRDQDGRDLLWNGDPAVWTGRAPILFPIVGALANGRYRLADKIYALPQHGFARRKMFEVVETEDASARLRLRADAETLEVYPFQFELDLTYVLDGAVLVVSAQVQNLGEAPMPASFGFHPAFRWPLPYGAPRAEHGVRFDREEPEDIRRIDAEGGVKAETYPTPVHGHDLALRDDLFVDDALIFDSIQSHKVSYGAPTGPRIEVAFPDTPYLGIWTKPGAGFICIEPWHGIADPAGFDGDFRDKPGVFEIALHQTYQIAMSIRLTV